MVISPIYITIGRMFEQNFLFEVPKYQRYYAWESEQVSDFIKDLDGILADSEKDHFFGGIVCVSKKVDGSTRQQKELIIVNYVLFICIWLPVFSFFMPSVIIA